MTGAFTIPGLKLVSESNAHEHWRPRQKRAKAQRGAALMLGRTSLPRWDGVADALGVNDRDPRIDWRVAQEKGRPREHAVRVEVRAQPAGDA